MLQALLQDGRTEQVKEASQPPFEVSCDIGILNDDSWEKENRCIN